MRKTLIVLTLLALFSSCTGGAGRPSPTSGGLPPTAIPKATGPDLYGPLGSEAVRLLTNDGFPKITVEFDVMGDRTPDDGARAHLVKTLSEVTGKRVDTTDGRVDPGDGNYGPEEIVALSKRNRSEGTTIHVLYLDGSFSENSNSLGVAISATLFAVFPDRISQAITALVHKAAIERSILVHETGHLFSLINIGHTAKIEHEDPDHPHHSNNKDSVMYWAVEDVSVSAILSGGPSDRFDEADKAELRQVAAEG